MFRIYALINNLNNEIFYIGQSRQRYLCKRKSNHIEDARKNVKTLKKNLYIRGCDYNIRLEVLEELNTDQEIAYQKEQSYIDLYKPCCNVSPAKSVPPKMGGHNKSIFPEEFFKLLGTLPDYKIAEKFNSNKSTVARLRKENGIKSYAKQTGNDGKHKKGIAKGTIKGFYTKIKPEIYPLMGTMPDQQLAKIAGVSHGCIFKHRKLLNIKSFGNNHGKKCA